MRKILCDSLPLGKYLDVLIGNPLVNHNIVTTIEASGGWVDLNITSCVVGHISRDEGVPGSQFCHNPLTWHAMRRQVPSCTSPDKWMMRDQVDERSLLAHICVALLLQCIHAGLHTGSGKLIRGCRRDQGSRVSVVCVGSR
jgi:hypothetical protein